MAALAGVSVSTSVDDFLAWNPGDDERWELVNGDPQPMARTGPAHDAIGAEIGVVIRGHLGQQDGQGFMRGSVIEALFHPVPHPEQNAAQVIEWLKTHPPVGIPPGFSP